MDVVNDKYITYMHADISTRAYSISVQKKVKISGINTVKTNILHFQARLVIKYTKFVQFTIVLYYNLQHIHYPMNYILIISIIAKTV